MNILEDFENIPLALHHIPVSPLRQAILIKMMLNYLNLKQVALKVGREEDELKYLLQINTRYASRIAEFMKLNKLSNEDAAKILKMDNLVLKDYLQLLTD